MYIIGKDVGCGTMFISTSLSNTIQVVKKIAKISRSAKEKTSGGHVTFKKELAMFANLKKELVTSSRYFRACRKNRYQVCFLSPRKFSCLTYHPIGVQVG